MEDMGREAGKEGTGPQGQGQLGLGIKAWRWVDRTVVASGSPGGHELLPDTTGAGASASPKGLCKTEG